MKRMSTHAPVAERNGATAWAIVATGICVAGLITVTAAAGSRPAQDPAADAFYKVCSSCHDSARIVQISRTRGGWEDIIDTMIDKGAAGTDQDFKLVLQYLLSHHGLVNVNEAPSDEIALVIGIPVRDSEAVVAFRKANGKFKDFEALTKVPGIDVKALQDHRAAILF